MDVLIGFLLNKNTKINVKYLSVVYLFIQEEIRKKYVVEIQHGGVTAVQLFYDERSCVMFAYLTCHSLVSL